MICLMSQTQTGNRSLLMNQSRTENGAKERGRREAKAWNTGTAVAVWACASAWTPLVAGCSSTDTTPVPIADASPALEAEAGDEYALEAAPDSSVDADSTADVRADRALDAAERGDGDWPPETCGRKQTAVCDFSVPDCDGSSSHTLWEYRHSTQWTKGVFVIRLPFDDPEYYEMAAWADWITPTYESLGIKFLFVVGYAKETEIAATQAECNNYKATAGGGLVNLTVLRDIVGPGSVNAAFECSTPYCYFLVNGEMALKYGLCGRYNYVLGPDVQADLESRLDAFATGE
jgi:hypothetical protein